MKIVDIFSYDNSYDNSKTPYRVSLTIGIIIRDNVYNYERPLSS